MTIKNNRPIRQLRRYEIVTIPPNDLSLITLSDNLRSLLSWKIKGHTHGFYSHSMLMHRCGRFASQGLFYREVGVWTYLRKHRLKFWHNPKWTPEQKRAIKFAVAGRLGQPWYLRLYDFKGILGQFIRRPWVHSAWRKYCSEDVGDILRLVEPGFNLRQPSPADINRWCKKSPAMVVYGVYDPDFN